MLHIEDNLANRRLIETVLSQEPQVRVLSAINGRKGLDLARQQKPDVILLDLHLPDMNGDEILSELRAEVLTRDTPVIVLSADATPQQIKRLLEMGVKNYLTKPLNIAEFLRVLEDTFNSCSNCAGDLD